MITVLFVYSSARNNEILHISRWEQLMSIATLYCGLSTWMSFIILSIVSIDSSFDVAIFPFN